MTTYATTAVQNADIRIGHMPTSNQRGRGHEPVTVLGSVRSAVALNIGRFYADRIVSSLTSALRIPALNSVINEPCTDPFPALRRADHEPVADAVCPAASPAPSACRRPAADRAASLAQRSATALAERLVS